MMIKKHNKRFSKTAILATVLSVLIFGSVSTTLAFLIVGTESIVNLFVPAKVETSVNLEDEINNGNNLGKRAEIYNNGDVPIYVRAAIVVNWVKTDENGERHVYSEAPKGADPEVVSKSEDGTYDYSIRINNSSWKSRTYPNGEVIYYFLHHVGVGENQNVTTNLFTKFKQVEGANQPEGYELEIEVVATGIQSVPVDVVEREWNVDIGPDGLISIDSEGNILEYNNGGQ